jgi:hypothetical protein
MDVYCVYCGSKALGIGSFCPKCGKQLVNSAASMITADASLPETGKETTPPLREPSTAELAPATPHLAARPGSGHALDRGRAFTKLAIAGGTFYIALVVITLVLHARVTEAKRIGDEVEGAQTQVVDHYEQTERRSADKYPPELVALNRQWSNVQEQWQTMLSHSMTVDSFSTHERMAAVLGDIHGFCASEDKFEERSQALNSKYGLSSSPSSVGVNEAWHKWCAAAINLYQYSLDPQRATHVEKGQIVINGAEEYSRRALAFHATIDEVSAAQKALETEENEWLSKNGLSRTDVGLSNEEDK